MHLLLTSFLFITNSIHAYYLGYFYYALTFLYLTLSSLFYHADHSNHTAFWFDQIAVYMTVSQNAYFTLFRLHPMEMIVPVVTSSTAAYLYYNRRRFSRVWPRFGDDGLHCCLHIVCWIGHHAVLDGLSDVD
jgi:hypothetical protein